MAQVKYSCPWVGCEFATVQKTNLKTHYRAHLKDKSKTCPECEFRTTDPASLTRHRKRIHGYTPRPRKARGRRNNRYTPYATPASPSSGSESDPSSSLSSALSSESLITLASESFPIPSAISGPKCDCNGPSSNLDNLYEPGLLDGLGCNTSFNISFSPLTPRPLIPAVESAPPLEMFKPFDFRQHSLLLGDATSTIQDGCPSPTTDVGAPWSQISDEYLVYPPSSCESVIQQMAESDPPPLVGITESDFRAIFGSDYEHHNLIQDQKFSSACFSTLSPSPSSYSPSLLSPPFTGSLLAELYTPLDL
ncbi:hypothetical protein GYMLUDRAFT_47122 [Collybiopsis luxurians FD-317 M1]|uniref:C2H2-type domain-containing protein n=1 Tax=Collybiopsis luxurians FD-317 M1 TaxID=944289 RepID=A0A0D0BN15_9AGAR|nr:hypothetical protein GYMLUDRAFT_47122 [Collybiopsis luxurians FD-317 M1]